MRLFEEERKRGMGKERKTEGGNGHFSKVCALQHVTAAWTMPYFGHALCSVGVRRELEFHRTHCLESDAQNTASASVA